MSPPPPIPAMTRPAIILHSDVARPQMRVPAAKRILEATSPVLRLNISVSRPERGWQAAFAMRYADASQERRERDWKEVEMGAARVATIVESRAPRNTPIQIVPRTRTRRLVEISVGIIVCSCEG